ncbi:LIM domain and actin-binding protein 1 isoform X2 [Culicoides brevitarsis]|uniref:LIM domain and actin-binding protein 1 isoform X2 n=1 Tax=Culicoides brevitarsis TaxID=469753 RepID=UPI00307C6FB2
MTTRLKSQKKIIQSESVETHSEEAYEEEHVIEIDEKGQKKVTSKSSKAAFAGSRATASIETNENGVSTKATMEAVQEKAAKQLAKAITNGNITIEAVESTQEETQKITGTPPTNKVKKVRKIKKGSGDSEKENISVRIPLKYLLSKSFSKFDALQKSASKASINGKPGAPLPPIDNNCKACGKTVFQMEQMKAERSIWHKNCFRCEECQKQLNFDTYESHEGKLYCKPHFKSLFSPKVVEDNEPVKPRKPQLIIAENQPVELPADVVRSSDKTDSGLEELQQLNLKSRFEVFEKGCTNDERKEVHLDRSPSGVKRSQSILSKLARFQAKGMEIGNLDVDGIPIEYSSEEEEEEIDNEETHEQVLERARRAQKEKPVVCANMDDIKTRFETGHVTTREERREEQKQELQSIRSRLFMGKQAKIKEMYQQAVEQSEQTVTTSKVDCDVDLEKARSIKEKFEKGISETDENTTKVPDEEMAVFEQGISKQSRSIFKELDANVAKQPASLPSPNISNSKTTEKRKQFEQQMTSSCEVVKSGEKVEDVVIATEDVSSKFKFFETYKPEETKKKEFRITPPREGVVKMPSPEQDNERKNGTNGTDNLEDDSLVAAKAHTASKMLSLFRQMEEKKHTNVDTGPKPLKRFTPPPDDNKRIYQDQDSADEYTDEEVEEEECEEEEEHITMKSEEEGLKAAKEAARAKLLREKFEKWEKSQIEKEQREQNMSSVNLYDENLDESQVESARSIRAKFENLHETRTVQKEQIKVNRFV